MLLLYKNRFGFFRIFEILVQIAATITDFPLFPTSTKKITPATKNNSSTSQVPSFSASQLPSFRFTLPVP